MSQFDSRDQKEPWTSLRQDGVGADLPSASEEQGPQERFDTESLLPQVSSAIEPDTGVRAWGERLESIIAGKREGDFRIELEAIPEQCREWVALYVLEAYRLTAVPDYIAANFDLFDRLNREVLTRRLLLLGEPAAYAVMQHLSKFDGVQPELIWTAVLENRHQLMGRKWHTLLPNRIEFFPPNLREQIVSDLLDFSLVELGIDLIRSCRPESHFKFAEQIVSTWEQKKGFFKVRYESAVETFIQKIESFSGIESEEFLKRVIVLDPESAALVALSSSRHAFTSPAVIAASLRVRFGSSSREAALVSCLEEYFLSLPGLNEKQHSAFLTRIRAELKSICPGWRLSEKHADIPNVSQTPRIRAADILRDVKLMISSGEKTAEIFERRIALVLGTYGYSGRELREFAAAIRMSEPVVQEVIVQETKRGARELIERGEIERGLVVLDGLNLTRYDLDSEVAGSIMKLLGAGKGIDDGDMFTLVNLAAWSVVSPRVIDLITDKQVLSRFVPIRNLYSTLRAERDEPLHASPGLQLFTEHGVPLLRDLGLLSHENLQELCEVLPDLLQQSGSKKAWDRHRGNLASLTEVEYDSSRRPHYGVRFEIETLINFYRLFRGAEAPLLYEEFRQAQIEDRRPSLSDKNINETTLSLRTAALLERVAQFQLAVLSGERSTPDLWTRSESQYLDAWTKSKGQVERRTTGILEAAPADPNSRHSFERRSIFVAAVGADKSEYVGYSSLLRVGYQRWRDLVVEVLNQSHENFLRQEAESIARTVFERREAIKRWQDRQEASCVPSWVFERNREELETLTQVIEEKKEQTSVKELIQQLLRVKHKSIQPSLARLVVADALQRHAEPAELLDSLQPEPSNRSVTALGEFIKNQLFDESFRALKLSGATRKTVVKALPSFDFEPALRALFQGENAGETIGGVRQEIVVYPTREVLAEMAGFFSDACWTDKIDLMKRHPNATALVFVAPEKHEFPGRGGSSAKTIVTHNLVGACYLLEAKDTAGNEVVVIRGINPRERPFEKLSMQSFIEGLIDEVVVPFAREVGVKKVVIPFDELGHAQTNRLRVGAYLQEQYGQMPFVPLDPKGPNTNFNDRRIFDKCRLVREL